jgi:hypothetical protein|tara:strand:- start:67 stop:300 length:234 start_codon:yes stop_codon:yes gene_type:complete
MATLNEIYDELDRLLGDIQEYIEDSDNGNLSSDLTSNVENPLETLLVALDNIIDDKTGGIYDLDGESDFLEDFEDFG